MLNYLIRIKTKENEHIHNVLTGVDRIVFQRNERKPKPFIVRCETLVAAVSLNLQHVQKEERAITSPWSIEIVEVCRELFRVKSPSTPLMK